MRSRSGKTDDGTSWIAVEQDIIVPSFRLCIDLADDLPLRQWLESKGTKIVDGTVLVNVAKLGIQDCTCPEFGLAGLRKGIVVRKGKSKARTKWPGRWVLVLNVPDMDRAAMVLDHLTEWRMLAMLDGFGGAEFCLNDRTKASE